MSEKLLKLEQFYFDQLVVDDLVLLLLGQIEDRSVLPGSFAAMVFDQENKVYLTKITRINNGFQPDQSFKKTDILQEIPRLVDGFIKEGGTFILCQESVCKTIISDAQTEVIIRNQLLVTIQRPQGFINIHYGAISH